MTSSPNPEALVPRGRAGPLTLLRMIRVHQWLKNLLILVPLLAAHKLMSLPSIGIATLSFVAFSLCASSVYVLNDLLDVESDRQHARKRNRPIAAGQVAANHALIYCPVGPRRGGVAGAARISSVCLDSRDLFCHDVGVFAAAQTTGNRGRHVARSPLHDSRRGRRSGHHGDSFLVAAGVLHVPVPESRRGEALLRDAGNARRGEALRLRPGGIPWRTCRCSFRWASARASLRSWYSRSISTILPPLSCTQRRSGCGPFRP